MMEHRLLQLPPDPLSARELEILHCLADGLSDDEIAHKLFLSSNTVKWHNRKIYQKLDVNSRAQAVALARTRRLLDPVRLHETPVIVEPGLGYLPVYLTSFVGRELEIEQIKQLVQESRLLTLTGPAGTGKTRLAIQTATELAPGVFKDGIYFVDLAPVSQPERVGDAIVDSLGLLTVTGQPTYTLLTNYLASRSMLILLDNFEHLLEAVPLIGDLLAAAPNLRVLVTSREALGLYGEQEYPVSPLKLPDLNDSVSSSGLSAYEAVVLFIQRALAAKPDFMVTDASAADVAAICVRLDGLPLAIELAAARVKVFTAEALLAHLQDVLKTLTGGARDLPQRQQTIANAIEWSYDLLDKVEQTLFARLSVFQGGRSFEAVDAVCMDGLGIDALEGLESLHNKSLLRLDEGPDGEPRFVMLETIHEFARLQLEQSGESESMRRTHAMYFAEMAETAFAEYRGARQRHWSARLYAERENIRAALQWTIDSEEAEIAIRLVTSLAIYWYYEGYHREGLEWHSRVQQFKDVVPAQLKLNFLVRGSLILVIMDDPDPAIASYEEGLALAQAEGDELAEAWALEHLAAGYIGTKDEAQYKKAVEWAKEGLDLCRRYVDEPGTAHGLNVLGELYTLHGDLEEARAAYEETLAIVLKTGERLREYFCYFNVGQIDFEQGNYEEALVLFKRGLAGFLDIRAYGWVVLALTVVGGVYAGLGEGERAARLIGASEALSEAGGMYIQSGDRPVFELSYQVARDAIGDELFDKLVNEGRRMTSDEALAFAREIVDAE